MVIFLSIIMIIGAVLLVLAILVQSPKSAGTMQSISSGSNFFGVQNTIDFLEKATWSLAAAVFGIALLFNMFIGASSGNNVGESALQQQLEKEQEKNIQPLAPNNAPANGEGLQQPQTLPIPAN